MCFSIAVSRSKNVPPFGPTFAKDARFEKSSAFRDLLLVKGLTAVVSNFYFELFFTQLWPKIKNSDALVMCKLCIFGLAINAENAVHRSDKFLAMATRTRQEYLKDLAQNYVSPTLVDSGSRLGWLTTSVIFIFLHFLSYFVCIHWCSAAFFSQWNSALVEKLSFL